MLVGCRIKFIPLISVECYLLPCIVKVELVQGALARYKSNIMDCVIETLTRLSLGFILR